MAYNCSTAAGDVPGSLPGGGIGFALEPENLTKEEVLCR